MEAVLWKKIKQTKKHTNVYLYYLNNDEKVNQTIFLAK